MKDSMFDKVSKPSRYMGGEIHSVQKDPRTVRTRFALIFPDAYEIGMSHLGLKILYHILNQKEDVAAERVYAPWGDMEKVLREEGVPLTSVESNIPLREFDILGITLPYELCYTNILTVLDLAGLPLRAGHRDAAYPLVLGGGTAVFNPEPVAEFFDAFVLGDGEDVIHEVVACHQQWKERGGDKRDLLESLARIEGVYVPSFYKVSYGMKNGVEGEIERIAPLSGGKPSVKRRIVEDLDTVPYPLETPMPYMQTVHDRLTVEVARGCTFGCRFCQAGITYRPVRERSPEQIFKIVEEGLAKTGYEEVSLVSLSTGDYACISPLLTSLVERFGEDRVSFSLPSLRIGTLTETMIREVTRTKNKGFTIAPEAGTERLRRVINKPIDEKEMEATASRVFEAGSKGIKLYFMLGLPSETLEDMDGIVSMAEKVLAVARRYGRGGRDITVSVSTFVPKAHTPFQWEGQIPIEEVKARGVYLRNRLKPLKVQFKQHSPETSFLEAVFSRGDRRLAAAIESAWRKGRRFDSWEEHQDLACWMETFRGEGIDPMFYANRMVPLDACLPWEHLDTLATKDFLVLDYKRSVKERVIPDCRYGRCYNCGVCNMEAIRGREDGLRPIAYRPEDLPPERLSALGTVSGDVRRIRGLSASGRLERTTLRLQHTKLDRMRWLSQVELVTLFQRALRRAGIPVAYSEGFSPHAKLSFGPALPVGTEGLAEYLDMELSGVVASSEIGEIEKRLNRELPEGIVVTRIGELPPGVPSLNRTITGFAYEVWVEGGIRIEMDGVAAGGLEGGDAAVPLSDTICVKRKVTKDAQRGAPGRVVEKEIDIRPLIEEIRWVSPNRISLFLTSDEGRGCRPVEVLSGVFGPDASRIPWRVLRTGCYQKAAGHWVPILSEVYHPCVHS